jgi:hypothetical protein
MRPRGRVALGLLAAFLAHVGVSTAAQGPVYDVSNTPGLAEGEETVAVNPTDPQDVIVGSNQWKPLDPSLGAIGVGAGGLTSCAVWASHDGGRTWTGGRLEEGGLGPNVSGESQPPIREPAEFGDADLGNALSADQNTVFDRHGNAYYQCVNFGLLTGDIAVNVYRSTDGGSHWSKPSKAFSELATLIQVDRPFLAIDDSGGPRDGTLYLTFESMFYQPFLTAVYARSSTDGGRSWGTIERVDSDAELAQWDPRQAPTVGADGALYVAYDAAQFVSPAPLDPQLTPLKLVVARSTDGGRTFRRFVVEPEVNRVVSLDEAFFYFTEEISAIAADPVHPGHVAVAWPDDRSGEARILLRYSTDGGLHWSSILDATDDPPGHANEHDHVALGYLPDGRLVVVSRDRRFTGGGWGQPFDVFARLFDPDPAGGLLPGATLRLTTTSQPDGQNTHGNMPTEYLGLSAGIGGISASWEELRGALLDDIYRNVPLADLPVAGAGSGGSRPAGARIRLSLGRACVRRVVHATVVGTGIRRIVFALDGRRIATLSRGGRGGRWTLRARVGRLTGGRHRLTARVRLRDGRTIVLRRALHRCAARG